jgi:chromosome partitioning protein
MSKTRMPTTIAFVSQKGGVGKSALARLLAVGAINRGRKALLADFDLDQLTCVEWGALRMRSNIEPEVDARAFKSLKKAAQGGRGRRYHRRRHARPGG